MSLTIATTEYLGTNLTQEMTDLCYEIYKTTAKAIMEDTKKDTRNIHGLEDLM